MHIRVISVDGPKAVNGKNYEILTVNYDKDGKTDKRDLYSFASKEVFDFFKGMKGGEAVEVRAEKDGKYWKWTEAKLAGRDSSESGGSGTRQINGGNWETKEERAQRQVYIIRQSSLSSAIAYHSEDDGDNRQVDQILETADRFTNWVLGIKGDII